MNIIILEKKNGAALGYMPNEVQTYATWSVNDHNDDLVNGHYFFSINHAIRDFEDRQCSHEIIEWIEDGNVGGFSNFLTICRDCGEKVDTER